MGTDQKWIQRSLIMSSVVLFMRGPKKALRIYMETYKTPEAMKWSISNLQSVSTNVWPCYTWDFRCETKEQKHLGRLYSLLFSIYTPRSLAPGQLSRTTENSKLPLKYKTALFLLFSWWIVYWRQRRAEGSELIQAIRRVLCKFRTTQGLAVASSGQPSKKLNKIITITGDGFSLLFLLCQLQNNHCLKRIGRVPSVLRGDLESPASRWP